LAIEGVSTPNFPSDFTIAATVEEFSADSRPDLCNTNAGYWYLGPIVIPAPFDFTDTKGYLCIKKGVPAPKSFLFETYYPNYHSDKICARFMNLPVYHCLAKNSGLSLPEAVTSGATGHPPPGRECIDIIPLSSELGIKFLCGASCKLEKIELLPKEDIMKLLGSRIVGVNEYEMCSAKPGSGSSFTSSIEKTYSTNSAVSISTSQTSGYMIGASVEVSVSGSVELPPFSFGSSVTMGVSSEMSKDFTKEKAEETSEGEVITSLGTKTVVGQKTGAVVAVSKEYEVKEKSMDAKYIYICPGNSLKTFILPIKISAHTFGHTYIRTLEKGPFPSISVCHDSANCVNEVLSQNIGGLVHSVASMLDDKYEHCMRNNSDIIDIYDD